MNKKAKKFIKDQGSTNRYIMDKLDEIEEKFKFLCKHLGYSIIRNYDLPQYRVEEEKKASKK